MQDIFINIFCSSFFLLCVIFGFLQRQPLSWRHDTQHSDTLHNDTQNYGLFCDTQHKRHSAKQLCPYAESRVLFFV
jgi:hypothetical protein